jgi:hypothetical protein
MYANIVVVQRDWITPTPISLVINALKETILLLITEMLDTIIAAMLQHSTISLNY